MHRKFKTIVILCFAAVNLAISQTATYYVSVNGADENPGTLNEPFLTIKKAADIMSAGDSCIIREGTYRETVKPLNQGSQNNPLVFTNFPGEQVIITGTDLIGNWTIENDNIWKTPVSGNISQLFINKVQGTRARFPNAALSMFDVENWADVDLASNASGKMTGINTFGNISGARVVSICGRNWVSVSGTIKNISGDLFEVNNKSSQWSGLDPGVYLGLGKGFVTGHKNLLDATNEWHYENNELYLMTNTGDNPNELIIEGRTRDLGFDLSNARYISIVGLHFKAANLSMRDAIGCLVSDCSFRYIKPFFDFKNGFNRDALDAETWEGNGIEVSGSNNAIQNCYIAHSWGDGITMWGNDNKIDNCIIEDCDWMGIDSAPICVTGNGHTVSNNTLRKTGRSVLIHRYLKKGIITNNDMQYSGLMTDDLGLLYSYNTDGDSTAITYNLVHDNKAEHTGPGIYLDNGDSNYLVHHNAVWNCSEGIRLNLPQENTNVYNNTFWNNNRPMGMWGPDGTEMVNCKMWNNIQDFQDFIGNDQKNNLFSTEDDMFIDSKKGNFRLLDGAEAVDYGINIPGVTTEITGAAPDVGAYELGFDWSAGSTISAPFFEDGLPIAPTGLSAEADSGKIILRWDTTYVTSHRFAVDRKQIEQSFIEVGKTNSDIFIFEDTTVLPSTAYIYRIRSVNNLGSTISPDYIKVTSLGDGSFVKLQAEEYDEQSGINNAGDYIGSCDNGDYVLFRNINLEKGFNTFSARLGVPVQYEGKRVLVKIDELSSTSAASLKTNATAGFDVFEIQKTEMDSTISGVHDIYFLFSGGSGVGDFDWFEFSNNKKEPEDTVNTFQPIYQPDMKSENSFLVTVAPNPFKTKTELSYYLAFSTNVKIQITEMSGKSVKVITIDKKPAGYHKDTIDLGDLDGNIYLLRIDAYNIGGRSQVIMVKQ